MTNEEAAGAANDFLVETLASFEERADALVKLATSLRRDISVFRRMNTALSAPTADVGPNYMGKD